ncbi:MAG: winged helix-turn-helix transcriptional regulator [Candidatus Aenigmarchaeota archaeon]|nr:winged helix-turn-helix transcriptional regulator [Candidatus Aenigmarchaeota archaeon]
MNKQKNALQELFLHDKPVKILMGLSSNGSKSYASVLAKTADCTYSHTVKILDMFKKLGLVQFEKSGRVKHIKLTGTGEDVAQDLASITRRFTKIESK